MHLFQVDGLEHELRVTRFEGREGISELFHFDVLVASPEKDIAFTDVVGKPALLTFQIGEQPRFVHGVVASFEQGEEGKRLTAYHATIVPDVARLKHRRNSRIFQALTAPEIIEKVLRAAGIPGEGYRFLLSGVYRAREYCVQYRESDFAFVSRLLEEEGICYYFEHGEGGHVLVFADSPSAHGPIAGEGTVVFRPQLGALFQGEHVSRFRYVERVRSGKVTLRDYNFKKPGLSLESNAQADADDDLEVYDYPGDYDAPGAGSSLAKIRLEQLQTSRRTGSGESVCPRFVPGQTFTLAEHGRDAFNREYLLVSVHHHGHEPVVDAVTDSDVPAYGNRFQVIPSDVPYRPPSVTPWPTIKGIQTAIVVGPPGEEVYTDEHGRIKVQFHWDREGKKDGQSSCWIRVSQIWAGAAWGAVFLPRIGHEVVVDFLEGDPDRPLVVGSVYHGTNVPPYALPAEKTKSTLKSNSSTGGGGFNELRFEDKKGSEEIFLHGQKDWNIAIEHDKKQWIGNDEMLDVARDRSKVVGNDQSEEIGGHKSIDVAKTHTETIGEDETLSVGGDRAVSVGGDHTESVSGSQSIDVGKGQSASIGEDKSESVGGSSSESVAKGKSTSVDEGYTLTVGKDMTVTIGKSAKEDVKEKKTMIIGEKLAIQCGDATITIEKNGNVTVQGKKITVKGEGPVRVEGKKLDVKSEGAVNVEASGNVKIKGSNVGVN
ncbi:MULTISPECIES: type VI secretion system Vgr family protein [Sorangium]|uniref:Type VI secretion protein VgrG n=1 Tax=Sorangium cellulosum TaxID=56 RepID=A0A4V0NGU5_SORCE|nr:MULTISPECIES: type VI secretion system tip protein VgrG [Sorangium]AUX34392.1 type VI secretion protein VgrG [Sorangium cellulosum]WCQ93708.1 Actin cross-linking toxin VgrG1 [Sorangium sp. Soce836]